jgi:hypothetical protein
VVMFSKPTGERPGRGGQWACGSLNRQSGAWRRKCVVRSQGLVSQHQRSPGELETAGHRKWPWSSQVGLTRCGGRQRHQGCCMYLQAITLK